MGEGMTISHGIAASAGIGIGTVCVLTEQEVSFRPRRVEDVQGELRRFRGAAERFREETGRLAVRMKETIGEQESAILLAQVDMLSDPELIGEIEGMIQSGSCSESAVSAVCEMYYRTFLDLDDDLMRQRAADVNDLKTRLLKILLGIRDVDLTSLPKGTVLVARLLTPSVIGRIRPECIAGILTETGGSTSHAAILARALEIPAVLSVPELRKQVRDGEEVILDGTEGEVVFRPEEDTLTTYMQRREVEIRQREELRKFLDKPTQTADGELRKVVCNIGDGEEAVRAMEMGGEGIGLFRTEFLFLKGSLLPTEEEQFACYRKVALTAGEREVILRTLDIGGDKELPCLKQEREDNPFLGFRAVRYCLKHPEVLRTQLRAILRASAFGHLSIMIPMVTCPEEVRSVRSMVEELKQELSGEGIAFDAGIRIGVMVETPAAAMTADLLAKEADFFSIGTNDLTQYVMSVDRGNSSVAYLYSPFQPAVLRAIRDTIRAGRAAGIPVGMCGEAAADPRMIPLLLSFGLTEFSVIPSRVLHVRASIAGWTLPDADRVTDQVMNMGTEEEIAGFLEREITN